tara:strand:+ start:264 stop:3698 length:3435 start_codon:yes stop_codon:yes gene_type:complete
MAETRARDLAKSLGQAVKTDNIASDGSLAVLGVTAYDSSGLLPSSYDSNNAGSLGFAKDSDRLYVHTGQGWFNIAIINTTPIFTTSPSASYTLATDATAYNNGTATTITLAARDSEGFPLTWTYSANSAFNNIAYVSNDSSVYTIIPKSQDSVGEASPAVGTLSFTASDGINTATASSTFSLQFDTTVANSESTSFFFAAQGNNVENHTVFADESDSPHTISDVSDNRKTYITSFSPYSPVLYSWLFGWDPSIQGTGADPTEYTSSVEMTVPSNGVAFGTGDYTIEYWCWNDESAGGSMIPFDLRGSGSATNLAADMFSEGTWYIRLGSGNIYNTSSTWRHPRYEWVHYAFVRASGTSKMYANGIEVASASDTNNYADATLMIGRGYDGFSGTNQGRWKGYIADFRIVKGTAVYTANFEPPTSPLTAISGTTVLTCNTPYVKGAVRAAGGSGFQVDNSKVTRMMTQPFSPYKMQEQWSSSKNGGTLSRESAVSVPGHTDFAFGTGDFTIELWYYRHGVGGSRLNLFDTRGSSNVGVCIFEDTDRLIKFSYGTTSSETANLVESNARDNYGEQGWRHIAVTRASGTAKFFSNGHYHSASNMTSVNINNTSDTVKIGNTNEQNNLGPIRVVKGTAVYSDHFYPPYQNFTKTGSTYHSLKKVNDDSTTAVDNSITASHTVFLANWSNWGVGSYNGGMDYVCRGGGYSNYSDNSVNSSTGAQKYSVPSLQFSKTNYDFLEMTSNYSHRVVRNIMPKESVTFEGWVQWNGTAETQDGIDPQIFSWQQSTLNGASSVALYCDISNSNKLTLFIGSNKNLSGGNLTYVGPSVNILDGNWHHFALVRHFDTGKLALFVDGTKGTDYDHTAYIGGIGYGGLGGNTYITSPGYNETGGWNGYMSQVRLKRGVAMYPFLPRKETLTTSTSFQNGVTVTASNTKLLCCHHSTITTDGSSNQTITANGSSPPTVSSFAPIGGMKSAYFVGGGAGGNASTLTTGSTADFAFGTGDATIELWAYFTSVAEVPFFVDFTNSSNTGYLAAAQYNGKIRVYNIGGSPTFYDGSTTIITYRWYHIALVRKSQVWSLFINGTLDGGLSWSDSQNYGNTTLTIGGRRGNTSNDYKFLGYISNLRVVKGQAIYDKDFTPPSTAMYG